MIKRDELVAMSMAGPRGDPDRRTRRLDLPLLALHGGPFRIWGRAHVPTGVDPVLYARRHGPLLALTEAIVEYTLGGLMVTDELAGLIVNLDLVDSIEDTGLLDATPEDVHEAVEAADIARDETPGP